jgi:PAS domain S-box-containing protein
MKGFTKVNAIGSHRNRAMNPGLNEIGDAANASEALRLELDQCQRRLDEFQKRARQLEDLFVHVADAIFVAETDGRIMDVNPAGCALLGYRKEELLAMHPWDFVESASQDEILGLIQNMRPENPAIVQRTYRCKSGEQKVMDLRLTRCDLAGRNLVVVSCRDITEQKRLENRLRQSERNLAEGQRLTKTGSWILDYKTGNTDWSVETRRIFGFPDPPPSPHYSEFGARVRPGRHQTDPWGRDQPRAKAITSPLGLRIRSFQLDPIHGIGGDEGETDKRNNKSNSHASDVHNAAHDWRHNRPTHDGHDKYGRSDLGMFAQAVNA